MNKNFIIPILRILDEPQATEFYIDFLGFKVDWAHRFQEDFPIYMQISKDGWLLHLTEHQGDGDPGANLLLCMPDVKTYQKELANKPYTQPHPTCETTEFNTIEMRISDPFGNNLTFYENVV